MRSAAPAACRRGLWVCRPSVAGADCQLTQAALQAVPRDPQLPGHGLQVTAVAPVAGTALPHDIVSPTASWDQVAEYVA